MRNVKAQSGWMARFVAIMALPLALHALYATGEKAVESFHLSQSAQAIGEGVDRLKQENLLLQQEINQARSDAEVERIAREQLGLIKNGDHPVVLLGPDGAPLPAPTAVPRKLEKAARPEDVPTWKQWWYFFFGGPRG